MAQAPAAPSGSTNNRPIWCVLPSDWRECVHLNGTRYFYHEGRRIITECDIYDRHILKEVLDYVGDHLEFLEGADIPDDLEMEVFGVGESSGSCVGIPMYSYKQRKGFRATDDGELEDYGDLSAFWQHVERFPVHRTGLPPNTETEFLYAVTYCANERVFDCKDAVYSFSDLQTRVLSQIYHDLKALQTAGNKAVVPSLVWHIARAMYYFEDSRQPPQTNEELTWRIRALDLGLMCLFFGVYKGYRRRLQGTRIRGAVYLTNFHEFIRNLLVEWADSNLLATVFVTANVAFLAAPGLDPFAKTASLVSTLFSLTSIVAGVHHVWRHRSKVDAEFEDARKYLHHVRTLGDELDLTVTACLISLPVASLIWSVLSFSIAIAGYCMQDSNLRGQILLSAVLGAGAICASSALVYFWHIWRAPPVGGGDKAAPNGHGLMTLLCSWVKETNLNWMSGIWRKQSDKERKADVV